MNPPNADTTLAFAATYALLGRLWLTELTRELLQKLAHPPMREAFESAGGKLPEAVDDPQIEILAIDYCKLFVGPRGHLPPTQSVWETGQFESEASASMREFVEAARYPISHAERATIDHLGCQLRLMGHLLEQSVSEDAGVEHRQAANEMSVVFFDRHLRWPTRLLNLAVERADTDFYRGMLKMTHDFLRVQAADYS